MMGFERYFNLYRFNCINNHLGNGKRIILL